METMTKGNQFISFRVCSIEPMTEKDARIYQTNKGYMPMGYGFVKFKCEKKIDSAGKEYYDNSWSCYSSCD